MGAGTTDGNFDVSSLKMAVSESLSLSVGDTAPPSRFLRALNFLPQEHLTKKDSELSAPSPVVVIRENGESDDDDLGDLALSSSEVDESLTGSNGAGTGGNNWRQGLMAMEGIDLPDYEDLDSLPEAMESEEEEAGLVLSLSDAFLDSEQFPLTTSNDPRQLWLAADEAEAAVGRPDENEKLSRDIDCERQIEDNMSIEGNQPTMETAVVPPMQETRLWTGNLLASSASSSSVAEDSSANFVESGDEQVIKETAAGVLISAILGDVPAPVSDSVQKETESNECRELGVKLAPGWKPLRNADEGQIESSGDEKNESDGEVEDLKPSDDGVVGEGENSDPSVRSVVRAPRHDSIVEGFGNFLNESVVLDAAFTEPDFKALTDAEFPSGEDDVDVVGETECADEVVFDEPVSELISESIDEPVDEPVSESVSESIDESTSESIDEPISEPVDEPISEPLEKEEEEPVVMLEVLPPGELDSDDVVPAAIVAPSLVDDEIGEEDQSAEELSELGRAGFSMMMSPAFAEGKSDSLLEELAKDDADADEAVDDPESSSDIIEDEFDGDVEDDAAAEEVPTGGGHNLSLDAEGGEQSAMGGFSDGNSALMRHGVRCPSCEQALRIQNRYMNIEGRCPACSEMIVAKCQASGMVIAELANVESPKFKQKPDIAPVEIWGGTRLEAGGGEILEPEVETESEPDDRSLQESVAEADHSAGPGPRDAEPQASDDDSAVDITAASAAAIDPFSNPSRIAADSLSGMDTVWGQKIGRPNS